MITQARIKELFRYDRKTGHLIYRKRCGHNTPGMIAGSNNHPSGYRRIGIDGKYYAASHLVWLYHKGWWPPELDHRDLNKQNNKISNLRLANRTQQNANQRARINNVLGIKGVHVRKDTGQFRATITIYRKQRCLGSYWTLEEARMAYVRAAKKLFRDFARAA